MDMAPELLKALQDSFSTKYEVDSRIRAVLKKIESGRGTYLDANRYAIRCGQLLSQTFGVRIEASMLPDGTLYYNIADRTVRPMLEQNYKLISEACEKVQETMNKSAGLGLRPLVPEMNDNRIQGLIDLVSTRPYEEVKQFLDDPVINFSQSVVDDSIEKNADFQYKAGMSPKIVRTADGNACAWCVELAGTYDYPCDRDVYQRHERCRCSVDYVIDRGRQDVYTKRWR